MLKAVKMMVEVLVKITFYAGNVKIRTADT